MQKVRKIHKRPRAYGHLYIYPCLYFESISARECTYHSCIGACLFEPEFLPCAEKLPYPSFPYHWHRFRDSHGWVTSLRVKPCSDAQKVKAFAGMGLQNIALMISMIGDYQYDQSISEKQSGNNTRKEEAIHPWSHDLILNK